MCEKTLRTALKMGISIWFLCLLSITYSFPDDVDKETCNRGLDETLSNLRYDRETMSDMDPLIISEITHKSLKLKNIVVKGLSNVVRSGDCIHATKGKKFTTNLSLLFSNISINADFEYQSSYLTKGTVEAVANMINTATSVSIDLQSGDVNLISFKITEFEIPQIQKVTSKNEMMNEAYRKLAQNAVTAFKSKIIQKLEEKAREYISNELKMIENFLKDIP